MSPLPLPAACIEELERQALEVTGVRFARLSRNRAQEALARILDERGEGDCTSMLKALTDAESGASLVEQVVGEATTKETYLFRDPAQFDALRDTILPEAAEAASRRDGVLRVWSAGCATGEEAYSVAMLLAEIPHISSVVLATDLSSTAIDDARAPTHSAMRLAPDALRYQPLVDRWTTATPGGLTFNREVTSRIHFARHNLMRDRVPAGQHVVLCRNVMIYLPPAAQGELISRLWSALLPGGCLLLGEAELLHVMKHDFNRMPIDNAVIYAKPLKTGTPT
ncbi:MAG: CheR family methyltransferase [Coriobacteriia bacterium]|nr:CheR family methyltransferase [Coriobacteriia bacterium]